MISKEPSKNIGSKEAHSPMAPLDLVGATEKIDNNTESLDIQKEKEKAARNAELEVVRDSISSSLLPYENRDFIAMLGACILVQGFGSPDRPFLARKKLTTTDIIRNLRDQIENISQVEDVIPQHLEILVELRLLREDEPGSFYLNPKPNKIQEETLREGLEEVHLFYDIYLRSEESQESSQVPPPSPPPAPPVTGLPKDKPKELISEKEQAKPDTKVLQKERTIGEIRRTWRLRENMLESVKDAIQSLTKGVGFFLDQKKEIQSELSELKKWEEARPLFHAGQNVPGLPDFEAFVDSKLPEIEKKTQARKKALESNPLAFSRKQLFQGGREKSALAIARTLLGEYEKERFGQIKAEICQNIRLIKNSLDIVEKWIKHSEKLGALSGYQTAPILGIIKDLRLPLFGLAPAIDDWSDTVKESVRVFSSFKKEIAEAQKEIFLGAIKAIRLWNAFDGWEDLSLTAEESSLIDEVVPERAKIRKEYLDALDKSLRGLLKEVSNFESQKKGLRTKLEYINGQVQGGLKFLEITLDPHQLTYDIFVKAQSSLVIKEEFDNKAFNLLLESHTQISFAFFRVMVVLVTPSYQFGGAADTAKEVLPFVYEWIRGGDDQSDTSIRSLVSILSNRVQWMIDRSPEDMKNLKDKINKFIKEISLEIEN